MRSLCYETNFSDNRNYKILMTSDNSQHCEAMDEATDDESPQSEQVRTKAIELIGFNPPAGPLKLAWVQHLPKLHCSRGSCSGWSATAKATLTLITRIFIIRGWQVLLIKEMWSWWWEPLFSLLESCSSAHIYTHAHECGPFRWGLRRRCCNGLRRPTRCWPMSTHCLQLGLWTMGTVTNICLVCFPPDWTEQLQISRNTQQLLSTWKKI